MREWAGGRKKKDANASADTTGIEPIEACSLLAEAAHLFGWKPDEVLRMRASLFFKVLRHGRKQYAQNRDAFIADLCNVAAIPLGIENHKTFSKYYRERAFGAPKRRALDLKDEKTAHILAGAFWASSPLRRH